MTAHSWLASANASDTDFPLQNLPYGVFHGVSDNVYTDRIGVAIGDRILDLDACAREGLLDGLGAEIVAACRQPLLNSLMALGGASWRALRQRLTELLQAETKNADENRKRVEPVADPDERRDHETTRRDRRLHRLFRVDLPCHERESLVSPRRSAAAKLQVCAAGLSWPRVVHHYQRHFRYRVRGDRSNVRGSSLPNSP